MSITGCPDRYVVVDLETTGLAPASDRILEIGAVKVIDGEVTETFCTFANPQMEIPKYIQELTGITQEMVAGEKTPDQAVLEFLDFCGDLDLIYMGTCRRSPEKSREVFFCRNLFFIR